MGGGASLDRQGLRNELFFSVIRHSPTKRNIFFWVRSNQISIFPFPRLTAGVPWLAGWSVWQLVQREDWLRAEEQAWLAPVFGLFLDLLDTGCCSSWCRLWLGNSIESLRVSQIQSWTLRLWASVTRWVCEIFAKAFAEFRAKLLNKKLPRSLKKSLKPAPNFAQQ